MIEWRAGSRLGKILFATGIAGCVLLGRTLGGRRRILVGILGSAVGIGALMIAIFAGDSEFQGAKTMPWPVAFVRAGFVLVGCVALVSAPIPALRPGTGKATGTRAASMVESGSSNIQHSGNH